MSVREMFDPEFCVKWVITYWWKPADGLTTKKAEKVLYTKSKKSGFGVRKYFKDKYPRVDIESVRYQ